jgi:hypothetical protein
MTADGLPKRAAVAEFRLCVVCVGKAALDPLAFSLCRILSTAAGSLARAHWVRNSVTADLRGILHARPPLQETSSTFHVFSHETADGERVLIGTWSPLRRDESAVVAGVFHATDNAGEAER